MGLMVVQRKAMRVRRADAESMLADVEGQAAEQAARRQAMTESSG
jgi:hypothetical protein